MKNTIVMKVMTSVRFFKHLGGFILMFSTTFSLFGTKMVTIKAPKTIVLSIKNI